MRAIITAASLLLWAPPALAEAMQFQTPSGNIGCEYQPETDDRLYCVRLEPAMSYIEFYPDGAHTGDYEGDSWFPKNAPVLEYGQTRDFGPYRCSAERSGLTCERGAHGFTASRKEIKAY